MRQPAEHLRPDAEPASGLAFDQALVARCLRGEVGAFDDLYRLHAPKLLRACASLLGDASEAEDALQLTFEYACAHLDRFRGESRLSTWLYGVALRIILNQRRSRSRRQRLRDAVSVEAPQKRRPTDPEQKIVRHQALGEVAHALEKLQDNKRTAFMLHVGAGLKLQEVAQAMNASVQTTFARIKSARAALLSTLDADPTKGGQR